MATTIKLKSGTGAPSAGDLVVAEPALDLTNKRLYTEDSGGTVIEVGTNPGTDVTFADNRKAIFGAGSDLQIYHDGFHSIIAESGGGSLLIRGDNTYFTNSAATKSYADFIADGAVTLRYNNLAKLATTATGIDVTGTVTADGLTVDGSSTLRKDSSDTTLSGAFATNDTLKLLNETDLTGNYTSIGFVGNADEITARIASVAGVNNGRGNLEFYYGRTSDGAKVKGLQLSELGDISFYEDTGTTAKLFWDASAESLGIGHSSPSYKLDVRDSSSFLLFASTDATTGSIARIRANGGSTEVLEIQANGNVGIGTSSPLRGLDLRTAASGFGNTFLVDTTSGTTGTGGGVIFGSDDGQGTDVSVAAIQGIKENSTAGNQQGALLFVTKNSIAQNTERMRINSSGNVGIGTSSPSQPLHVYHATTNGVATFESGDANVNISLMDNATTAANYVGIGAVGNNLTFISGNGSERMRIDSSGNVGIGTNNPSSLISGGSGTTLNIARFASGGVTTGDKVASVVFKTNDGSYTGTYSDGIAGEIASVAESATGAAYGLAFYTGTISGSNRAERLRIDNIGNLLVGTNTTDPVGANVNGSAFLPNGRYKIHSTSGADPVVIGTNTLNTGVGFYYHNGTSANLKGSIDIRSGSVAYNTTSDYRLKENVVPLTGATERLKQLNPSRFNFIEDADTTVDGFLAHEVSDVVPEAVTGTKDAMRDEEYEVTPAVLDDDGNVVTEAVMGTRSVPDYQGIDQSKLVPLLVATIQELEARITALESN